MEPRDFFATYRNEPGQGDDAERESEVRQRAGFAPAATASYEKEGPGWSNILLGALAGAGIAAAAYSIFRGYSSKQDSRVLRMEDSIQIGRRVDDVFRAWSNYEQLSDVVDFVREVSTQGSRSRWKVHMDGHDFEWEARTVQFIPGQAIGWKSVSGPKHTGRITFAPIGDDTLVQVTINYAPPLGILSSVVAPFSENIASYLSRGLREFKEGVETRRSVTEGPQKKQSSGSSEAGGARSGGKVDMRHSPARAEWKNQQGSADAAAEKATGTFGSGSKGPVGDADDTAQKNKGTVDYTRPTKPKYP